MQSNESMHSHYSDLQSRAHTHDKHRLCTPPEITQVIMRQAFTEQISKFNREGQKENEKGIQKVFTFIQIVFSMFKIT